VSVTAILDRLQGVRANGSDRWNARCPAHADKSPSLSIRELPDGRVLLHCFAGCGAVQVLESVGLGWSDVFPKRLDLPERRHGIPASWALEVLNHEALIVGIVAADIAAGLTVSPADAERVAQAAGRIASVVARTHS
jgi:hypothetical protein